MPNKPLVFFQAIYRSAFLFPLQQGFYRRRIQHGLNLRLFRLFRLGRLSQGIALQASFHKVLDELEKTRFEASIASFEELYRFFLLPAVLLVALEALLHALVLRRFP